MDESADRNGSHQNGSDGGKGPYPACLCAEEEPEARRGEYRLEDATGLDPGTDGKCDGASRVGLSPRKASIPPHRQKEGEK